MVFVDQAGEEWPFELIEQFSGLEKITSGSAECENGNLFTPFYNRESYRNHYRASDGAEIIMALSATTSCIVREEGNRFFHNQDRLSIQLIFPGCDTLRESRSTTDFDDNNLVVIDSPFPVVKFGIRHENVSGVIGTSWRGEYFFVLGKGLVALNYCDRDWILKED